MGRLGPRRLTFSRAAIEAAGSACSALATPAAAFTPNPATHSSTVTPGGFARASRDFIDRFDWGGSGSPFAKDGAEY